MAETKLTNLVNPEVMADMISAEYEKKLQLIPFCEVDNTLNGQPGNTITVPKWEYIGEAEDLAEGAEGTLTTMSNTTQQATIKKAFKGVELTDEAVLSGYGDPIGEATKQLGMSLADKTDSDLHASLAGIKSQMTYSPATKTIISYDNIVNAIDLFQDEEQGEEMYVIIHPKQLTQLRLDKEHFTPASELGDRVVETGVVGTIAGAKVVLSKKIKTAFVSGSSGAKKYINFIVKNKALTIYTKREALVETQRNITKKTTVITADEHYTTALTDTTKAVKFEVLEVPASA